MRPSQQYERHRERGVTLPLMVFAIVIVLGMAALAIDIATLYLAKSEAQRAADAAALAAARAFVLVGTTTDVSSDVNGKDVATTLAQQQAQAAVAQNNIAGHPGQLVPPLSSNPLLSFNDPTDSNPTVTVTVEQLALPTFFSRIWSRAPNSVSASAMAEAYNPSGGSTNPPVNVQCVKPFIVPNLDPGHPIGPSSFATLIDPSSGVLTNPGRTAPIGTGVVGELIRFRADCPNGGCSNGNNKTQPSALRAVAVPPPPKPGYLDFISATLPAATSGTSCPSCRGGGGSQFEDDISCCNTAQLACSYSASTNPVTLNFADPGTKNGPMSNGLQCLIHQQPGDGMDSLDPNGFPFAAGNPFRFQAGPNNPLRPRIATGDMISTSDSVITLMIYDGAPIVPPNNQVNIVGYMQVFVKGDNNGGAASLDDGSFDGYVINVSGCGAVRPGPPINGGFASPISVRLIRP